MYIWHAFDTMKLFVFENLTVRCVLYTGSTLNMTKVHEREKGYSIVLSFYSVIMFQELCLFANVTASSCQMGFNIFFCQFLPCLCDVLFWN
jgi:hypothetical protein